MERTILIAVCWFLRHGWLKALSFVGFFDELLIGGLNRSIFADVCQEFHEFWAVGAQLTPEATVLKKHLYRFLRSWKCCSCSLFVLSYSPCSRVLNLGQGKPWCDDKPSFWQYSTFGTMQRNDPFKILQTAKPFNGKENGLKCFERTAQCH